MANNQAMLIKSSKGEYRAVTKSNGKVLSEAVFTSLDAAMAHIKLQFKHIGETISYDKIVALEWVKNELMPVRLWQ